MLLQILGIVIFFGLIVLSIGLHEVGHMVPAKKFGLRVPEYMIGFGPRIWSKKKGETEYGFKAIPVGGYVKIVGMFPPEDETTKPKRNNAIGRMISDVRTESWKDVRPGETNLFYKLPVHKRLIIMFGGPFMNLVLAFVFFGILIVGLGLPQLSPKLSNTPECVAADTSATGGYSVAELDSSSTCPSGYVFGPAYAAGIKQGDRIIALNNTPINNWDDLLVSVASASDEFFDVQVESPSGDTRTVSVQAVLLPRNVVNENSAPTEEIEERYVLGVSPSRENVRGSLVDVPIYTFDTTLRAGEALLRFPQKLRDLTVDTIIQGQERSIESPVSVVGVSRIGGEIAAAEQPIDSKIIVFLGLIGSVNLFLFLFNLLPILPLDGGHMAVASYEGLKKLWFKITRKKTDVKPADAAKLMPVAYFVTVLLIAMGAVVIYADIFKPIQLFN